MEEEGGFRRLVAWQKAFSLAIAVHRAAEKFPGPQRFGLTSQLQRAAFSVPSNIAEGYGRGRHTKDYARFLLVARGSLYEVETALLAARELRYLDEEAYGKLDAMRAETSRVLGGLIRAAGADD